MSVKEDSSAAASQPLSQSTKVQQSANKALHAEVVWIRLYP